MSLASLLEAAQECLVYEAVPQAFQVVVVRVSLASLLEAAQEWSDEVTVLPVQVSLVSAPGFLVVEVAARKRAKHQLLITLKAASQCETKD